jgi:hypothetical protein
MEADLEQRSDVSRHRNFLFAIWKAEMNKFGPENHFVLFQACMIETFRYRMVSMLQIGISILFARAPKWATFGGVMMKAHNV